MGNNPYSEMLQGDGTTRPHYLNSNRWLKAQPVEHLAQKCAEADALFHRVRITFAVHGQEEGAERLIPFDIVPRMLPRKEWILLESGLKQRVRALNAFNHDIYHDQRILKAEIIPAQEILCNSQYRPAVRTYCRLAVGRDYLDVAPERGVRPSAAVVATAQHVTIHQIGYLS